MGIILKVGVAMALNAALVFAQSSPATQAVVRLGDRSLMVKYSAPSVRGRKIFGPGGLLSRDPTYPAWRAGANSATSFHTDADLTVGNVNVPKGDYTLYVWVKDPEAWELIISKETGQWGLDYHADKDLGRVKMTMSKPATLVEKLRYTLSAMDGKNAKLELAWENHEASVVMTLK
jgi:hypothetical protein